MTSPARLRGSTELEAIWKLALADYVSAAEVAPSGRYAVVGVGAGLVLGLDVATGNELFRHRAHTDGVFSISVAPDGARFATAGADSAAKLWAADGTRIAELPGDAHWVEHVAWAPDGSRLATAAGRKVRLWTPGGDPMVESEPFESTVTGLAWRRDGSALAAICYGGVHILPFKAGVKSRHLAWKGSLISVSWSPDGKVIACGSQDSSVHFWRLATGKDSEMRGFRFKPKALSWDAESSLLATGGDAKLTVWDFRKGPEGTRPIELDAHGGACSQLSFSPRRCMLASGSQDTSVLLWEPRRGVGPVRFGFLEDEVTTLRWHPEHQGLLGADASGTVAYWSTNQTPRA